MKSLKYHLHGLRISAEFLAKGKFLWYFLPGLVITGIYYWIKSYTASIEEAAMLASDYGWLDWIYGGINSVTSGVFSLLGFISNQFYIFIVITALSPFNTALSENFDAKLTGLKPEFNLLTFINDFLRMVLIVILAILMEFAFLLVYWSISFLFGLDFLDPIMYFLIAAFFFGFSFYDFSLERYRVNVGGSLYYAFSNVLTMILTGAIFLLIYKIPIIGIPIAPVVAVMVSTVVYLYSTNRLPKVQAELSKTNE